MANRWAWRTVALLLLCALAGLGAWRLSTELPRRLRQVEAAIREEASRYGIAVTFRNLRFHFLYFRVSLEDIQLWDNLAKLPLGAAGRVDVSLSPRRLLFGQSPVSRIRVRNYRLAVGEANRAVIDRLLSPGKGGGAETPEILMIDGGVHIGPFGPLAGLDARVKDFRVRPVRFLGTRVTVAFDNAVGALDLPRLGSSAWPLAEGSADLFYRDGTVRIRRLRAQGAGASVRLSGVLSPGGRTNARMSGVVDLARWIEASAPGARQIGGVVRKGDLEFSGALSGPWDDPAATGWLAIRNALVEGAGEADIDIAGSGDRHRIRIDSLKGTAWKGALEGSGSHDFDAGRGEGRLSLARAALGSAPWKAWGSPVRPVGAGNVDASLSWNREKVGGTVSLSVPEGVEGDGGGAPWRLRVPVSATVAGDYRPQGRELGVASARVRAGVAEAAGSGTVSLAERSMRLSGTFGAAAGRAADFGWNESLAWKRATGEWETDGSLDRPRVAVRADVEAMSLRALPPVPLSVRLEGDSGDLYHFVADIPADVARVTAAGTVTAPFAARPFLLSGSVTARSIDFSAAARWLPAVLASLRRESPGAQRLVEGLAGGGSADLDVTLSGGEQSVAGSLQAGSLTLGKLSARSLLLDGEWYRRGDGNRWKARATGEAAGGILNLSGEGTDNAARVTGNAERIELAQAVALLGGAAKVPVAGTASLRGSALLGREGWEVTDLRLRSPRLAAGGLTLDNVTGEGAMGPSKGTFVLASVSPPLHLSGTAIRREGWPVEFALNAVEVPAGELAAAAGRAGLSATGKWSVDATGALRAGDLGSGAASLASALDALRFRVLGSHPSVSGVSFDAWEMEGRKEGDDIEGEIRTRTPDTRLAFSLAMREPFGFRVRGPFSAGSAGPPEKEEGRTRFFLAGRMDVAGALRALEKTSGSLAVERFLYRGQGLDLSGRDLSAKMGTDGIRWTGGTLLAAGNPLNVSGKTSWKGDLDLRVDGKIPASGVRVVTDVFDRLDGMLTLDLRIAGKWDDPAVFGTGRLEDGIFSFRGYNQLFEEMRADAVISREKIVFEHFEGRSGGGYIDGRGELPLRFDARQRMFFSVDFLDMRYPYPEDFRPVIQGHAELAGPVEDLLVTGDVEVQSALYTKSIRTDKLLPDFRQRVTRLAAPPRGKDDFRVRLDIDVVADGTIRIKNNLADATAKGEVKIVGDSSRIILLGSFDVLEGTIDFQGNRYDVKRLSVEFNDPRRNNPRLEGRAETRKSNVTVTVSLSGTLEKPEVDLSSDPPLSKNDIVALLSLGVTAQSLAGQEQAVGQAVGVSLVAAPYKGRVEEGIRNIVGLDKFAVEAAFSSSTKSFEPRFIVGKSFGDRLTVSVSTLVGTTSESSATAELRIMENVFLQGAWESATTTREGDVGADIKFKYRYRTFRDFFGGRD